MKNYEPPRILCKTLPLAESWQNCANILRSKDELKQQQMMVFYGLDLSCRQRGADLDVSLCMAELERNLVIDPENLVN